MTNPQKTKKAPPWCYWWRSRLATHLRPQVWSWWLVMVIVFQWIWCDIMICCAYIEKIMYSYLQKIMSKRQASRVEDKTNGSVESWLRWNTYVVLQCFRCISWYHIVYIYLHLYPGLSKQNSEFFTFRGIGETSFADHNYRTNKHEFGRLSCPRKEWQAKLGRISRLFWNILKPQQTESLSSFRPGQDFMEGGLKHAKDSWMVWVWRHPSEYFTK